MEPFQHGTTSWGEQPQKPPSDKGTFSLLPQGCIADKLDRIEPMYTVLLLSVCFHQRCNPLPMKWIDRERSLQKHCSWPFQTWKHGGGALNPGWDPARLGRNTLFRPLLSRIYMAVAKQHVVSGLLAMVTTARVVVVVGTQDLPIHQLRHLALSTHSLSLMLLLPFPELQKEEGDGERRVLDSGTSFFSIFPFLLHPPFLAQGVGGAEPGPSPG